MAKSKLERDAEKPETPPIPLPHPKIDEFLARIDTLVAEHKNDPNGSVAAGVSDV